MTGTAGLVLRVRVAEDGDDEDLADLTLRLRMELLDLDVYEVEPRAEGCAPGDAKGMPEVTEWLAVHLGAEGLRTVLVAMADWTTRNDRTVEVSSGGDVLKLTRASRAQQERIVDAWLARHAPGP
jgi:hypothetical protein